MGVSSTGNRTALHMRETRRAKARMYAEESRRLQHPAGHVDEPQHKPHDNGKTAEVMEQLGLEQKESGREV